MRKFRLPAAWFLLIAVNVFWLGLNIRNNAVNAIFMPFLVERFTGPEIHNTALGVMRTAGMVIAMLVQPAVGLLSDRSTSRFGRRRPFLVAGVVFDVILLAWIALAGSYWSLLAAVLFFQVSSNISHGALQSLIPDLVPENQRGTASAIKAIFELLPVVLLGVTIAPLVGMGHFTWAVAVTAAALIVILLIAIWMLHETPLTEPVHTPLSPDLLRVWECLEVFWAERLPVLPWEPLAACSQACWRGPFGEQKQPACWGLDLAGCFRCWSAF